MCVIMIADAEIRPTDEMVRQGFAKNSNGAGVAWREKGLVKWAKGLTMDEVLAINRTLPFPYVLHFRAASPNTAIGAETCHPFAIDEKASAAIKGESKLGVLFHNGFWTGWKDKLLAMSLEGVVKLPRGPWTDTRAMALATAAIGPGFLELLDEKTVLFQPHDLDVYGSVGGHDGWVRIEGVWCSNERWKGGGGHSHQGNFYHGTVPASMGGGTTKGGTEGTGGSSQGTSFRDRGSVQAEQDQQERVQAQDATAHGRRVAEPSAGASTGEGQAKQGTETRITSEEVVRRLPNCEACLAKGSVVRARIWEHGPTHTAWCQDCYRSYRIAAKGPNAIIGEVFIAAPNGGLVKAAALEESARCGFCRTLHTIHRTKNAVLAHGAAHEAGTPICSTCWWRLDKPLLTAPGPVMEVSTR